MKKSISILFALLVITSMVLASCAQPTPETIVETVVVTEVVEVEGETVVETQIVEVVVTPEPEPEMFPSSGELPVEEESFEEPEIPEEPAEPAELSLPASEEPEEPLPQEETKSFTFNDKIMRRAPMSPMSEEEDFSINPSANR